MLPCAFVPQVITGGSPAARAAQLPDTRGGVPGDAEQPSGLFHPRHAGLRDPGRGHHYRAPAYPRVLDELTPPALRQSSSTGSTRSKQTTDGSKPGSGHARPEI